jgi:hypothetical protein
MNATGPRFELGQIVATPGALDALGVAKQVAGEFIARHIVSDWGDVRTSDARLNDQSIGDGTRILSAYKLSTGVKVWVITEADRSSTCILLPEEY